VRTVRWCLVVSGLLPVATVTTRRASPDFADSWRIGADEHGFGRRAFLSASRRRILVIDPVHDVVVGIDQSESPITEFWRELLAAFDRYGGLEPAAALGRRTAGRTVHGRGLMVAS
jgi:hypothetical protein